MALPRTPSRTLTKLFSLRLLYVPLYELKPCIEPSAAHISNFCFIHQSSPLIETLICDLEELLSRIDALSDGRRLRSGFGDSPFSRAFDITPRAITLMNQLRQLINGADNSIDLTAARTALLRPQVAVLPLVPDLSADRCRRTRRMMQRRKPSGSVISLERCPTYSGADCTILTQ
jgi:hypothetical protein